MSVVAYAIIGLIVGLFIVRRVKIGLGIPVLGDGHLMDKMKKRMAENRAKREARRLERGKKK